MGVKGLTTLIDAHPEIYQDVRFRGRRLVIDSSNLFHLLYFNSGLDQNHGGEYAAFEEVIERFVTTLTACQVTPYIVLDGGSDVTDKKLETSKQRAADRIRRANRAAAEGTQENIPPPLAHVVFKQTLARLDVKVARCFEEADREIAALANELQCPVLSGDSDFYVFDLSDGLLPFSHFQWEAVGRSGLSYIPCKKYTTSSFCRVFSIQPQLLPTFAALAGNDYVKLQRMELFVRWAQFDTVTSSGRQNQLVGLLCWLRDIHQPPEALQKLLQLIGHLSREKEKEVKEALRRGIEEYQLPASDLKMFFMHNIKPSFPQGEGLVPDWIQLLLVQARLTSDILDVLRLQRLNLSFSVGLAEMPSANLTSRPLRQVIYGLLLGHILDRDGPIKVRERDREGLELRIIPVPPTFTTTRLQLSSLNQVEDSLRLQVLLEALGVTEASLSSLPPQLRLPVAVTCYWWKQAQPPPDMKVLKALLLGINAGDALRRRAAPHIRAHPLDGVVSHAFTQWQICLKDSIHLNQLLVFPLPEPQIARIYEGALLHHLVHLMSTGNLENVLEHHYFSNNNFNNAQYENMLTLFQPFQTRHVASEQPPRSATLYETDEVTTIAKAMQDVHLEDSLTLRSRYTANERRRQSKNPLLVRKGERRGQVQL